MKKMRILALLLAICLLAAPAALAANNTLRYSIAELGLSLELPFDYVFFTRSTLADDPALDRYGLTYDQLMSSLYNNNQYGNGWPEFTSFIDSEFTISMVSLPVLENLSEASSFEQTHLLNTILGEVSGMGWTVNESGIVEFNNVTFLATLITQPRSDGGNDSIIQFSTVDNYRLIHFTLRSYRDPLTEEDKETLRAICTSVDFDASPIPASAAPEPATDFNVSAHNHPNPSDGTDYITEPLTGASFAIPEGWALNTETYDSLETVITLVRNGDTCSIAYSCIDMFASVAGETGDNKRSSSVPRSILNNDFFTLQNAADMFGVDVGDVSMRTYGNVEFFVADGTKSYFNHDVHVSYALHCSNGYMHMVMYMGDDGARTNEFATMMNTFRLG